MFEIKYSKRAAKKLVKLPRNTQSLIEEKLQGVALDPQSAPNVKALTGAPDYRLRVGNWRVIFSINDNELVISVIKIASRGEVYKQ